MEKIKAVIFDMDGLLLDTEKMCFRFFKEVFSEYGYGFTKEFFLLLVGKNINLTNEIILERYGSGLPIELLRKEISRKMLKEIKENGADLKPGVIELLEFLKEKEYKTAVATSTKKDSAEIILEKAGIKGKFDYIIGGDEIVNSKPNPEIFLRAAKALKAKNEDCIVLEDSKAGIQAAFSAGMKGINVPDMKMPDNEVKEKAFKIFNDLNEVKNYMMDL